MFLAYQEQLEWQEQRFDKHLKNASFLQVRYPLTLSLLWEFGFLAYISVSLVLAVCNAFTPRRVTVLQF